MAKACPTCGSMITEGFKRKYDYEAIKQDLRNGATIKSVKMKFGCSSATVTACKAEIIGERNKKPEIKQQGPLPKGKI